MSTGHAQPHVLREYALLADGARGVLVGPRGELAWMCFPGWDSDAIFAGLIGGGGAYAITPRGRFVWGGSYDEGTLIWTSRWVTEDGVVECRDALAAPGEPDRAVILRRVLAREGDASLDVVLGPRAGFGRQPPRELRLQEDGSWTARTGEHHVRWTGAAAATARADELELGLALRHGEHRDLVLEIATDAPAGPPPEPDRLWAATRAFWETRIPALGRLGSSRRDARHAFAVLTGLTDPGGGLVAAATTSLPERAGRGRSYDYRYVWIRDQCYAGQAVAAAGEHELLAGGVRFVRDRLLDDGARIAPAYTAAAGRVPDEHRVDLPGYPGGTDIAGNRVSRQFQLDVFGEALLLFAAAARRDALDGGAWSAAETAAGAIEQRWREPDAGIWELEPDRWTHSRLICAAGLRAIGRHAPRPGTAERWRSLADAITARATAEGLHPAGRWQRSPTDGRLDASLLLAAIRGAVPPADPRSLATLRAVESELTEDGYCYRFRQDDRPLGEAEGAFLLCGFWLALAHAQHGDLVAATRWFERNRAACGPPGLLSEEFDVRRRQLRGNLPQAFVHALLLETAVTLGDGR